MLDTEVILGDRDVGGNSNPGNGFTDSSGRYVITYTADKFADAEKSTADLWLVVKGNNAYSPDILFNTGHTGVNKNVILYVFDAQGKLLFKEETHTRSDTFERKLDFSYKESGIYYIRLLAGNRTASGKMVVVR